MAPNPPGRFENFARPRLLATFLRISIWTAGKHGRQPQRQHTRSGIYTRLCITPRSPRRYVPEISCGPQNIHGLHSSPLSGMHCCRMRPTAAHDAQWEPLGSHRHPGREHRRRAVVHDAQSREPSAPATRRHRAYLAFCGDSIRNYPRHVHCHRCAAATCYCALPGPLHCPARARLDTRNSRVHLRAFPAAARARDAGVLRPRRLHEGHRRVAVAVPPPRRLCVSPRVRLPQGCDGAEARGSGRVPPRLRVRPQAA